MRESLSVEAESILVDQKRVHKLPRKSFILFTTEYYDRSGPFVIALTLSVRETQARTAREHGAIACHLSRAI